MHEPAGTAAVADACVFAGKHPRTAPATVTLQAGPPSVVVGRAVAVRHRGSVDVFLAAIEQASAGDVLVVDNGGRPDEGCIGDLVALEAQLAGIAGIVIWGRHRDARQLAEIGLPLWSEGAVPNGPLDLRPDDSEDVMVGAQRVETGDTVVADADGVIFVAADEAAPILAKADEISRREQAQASAARSGRTLREQLRFGEYLEAREDDPELTFRVHLRRIEGEIEA